MAVGCRKGWHLGTGFRAAGRGAPLARAGDCAAAGPPGATPGASECPNRRSLRPRARPRPRSRVRTRPRPRTRLRATRIRARRAPGRSCREPSITDLEQSAPAGSRGPFWHPGHDLPVAGLAGMAFLLPRPGDRFRARFLALAPAPTPADGDRYPSAGRARRLVARGPRPWLRPLASAPGSAPGFASGFSPALRPPAPSVCRCWNRRTVGAGLPARFRALSPRRSGPGSCPRIPTGPADRGPRDSADGNRIR